jgi:two-component system response regulator HydG
MYPKSLKSKLLSAVAVFVLAGGAITSLLVSHRYHMSLFQGAASEAERIAHNLALDLADKILINDRIALQKLMDDRLISNPSVAYLFVVKDRRVLIHSFSEGIPAELIQANLLTDVSSGRLEKIVSETGERYLDVAWPIFDGKAGILRLGFSEKAYRQKVARLWMEISVITFAMLLLSLSAGYLFIRRITLPLTALTRSAEKMKEGNLDIDVKVESGGEIGLLAASFQSMADRISQHTRELREHASMLEEKNRQLDRAYRQTRISFSTVQEIGTLPNLTEVSLYLLDKLQEIVTCRNMYLTIMGTQPDSLIILSREKRYALDEHCARSYASMIEPLNGFTLVENAQSVSNCISGIDPADKIGILPVRHENQLFGALLIACRKDCRCVTQDLEVVDLLLSQTAGVIRRAARQEEEILQLKNQMKKSAEYSGLIGKDPRMQSIYRLIENVAATDATILIQGESGTGKELVARAIHQQSARKNGPFVVINCSAYPSTLLESEIFGHEKGAFTGAVRQKPGRFEQANGGTVFLDEIGEISPSAQIKLLRVLQSRKFERVGGEKTLEVDVRVLAATNKNLIEQVNGGGFREDLFYRLNVIPIDLPPLRKRRNDIPLLARHFLAKFVEVQKKPIQDFSAEAMRLLLNHHWPGNVRELENSVEHAIVLCKEDRIEPADLPEIILEAGAAEPAVPKTIFQNEMQLLKEVLEECNWNKTAAAGKLGISRSTLYEKLKRYRLTPPTFH